MTFYQNKKSFTHFQWRIERNKAYLQHIQEQKYVDRFIQNVLTNASKWRFEKKIVLMISIFDFNRDIHYQEYINFRWYQMIYDVQEKGYKLDDSPIN